MAAKAHPLYDYLKREKSGLLGSSIKWNFTNSWSTDGQGGGAVRADVRPENLTREIEALL
jgi:glutathione peroxidase